MKWKTPFNVYSSFFFRKKLEILYVCFQALPPNKQSEPTQLQWKINSNRIFYLVKKVLDVIKHEMEESFSDCHPSYIFDYYRTNDFSLVLPVCKRIQITTIPER